MAVGQEALRRPDVVRDKRVERAAPPTAQEPPGWWLRLRSVLVYTALVAVSVAFMAPLLWLLSASLKTRAEVFSGGLIPTTWRWENYVQVFDAAPVWTWLWNSFMWRASTSWAPC